MALVNSAFTVNVTPGAMPPTVHVSEYDIGRTYTVTINGENGSAFNIPSGTTATVEGTLNGVTGFTTNATISGSTVSFTLTESMTAKSGKAWCKIKLTLNSEPIQTCAFILAVDRAGVEADTVIGAPGFEEQIQNAVDNYLEEHPVDVEVDTTLTVPGKAADAAKTGEIRTALDEIDNLQSSSEGGTTTSEVDLTYTFEDGAINSTGADVDGNGNLSTYYRDSSCRTVGFISIAGAISVGLTFERSASATLPQGADHFYTYLFFYDGSRAFISRSGGEDATTISVDSVPENAAYVRASFTFTKQADVLSSRISAVRNVPSGEDYHPIVLAVLENSENIDNIDNLVSGGTEVVVEYNTTLESGGINSSGENITGRHCRTKEYVDVSKASKVGFSIVRVEGARPSSDTFHSFLCFYDASYTFIERQGGQYVDQLTVDRPQNAEYARVSFSFTELADVQSYSVFGVELMGGQNHPIVDAVLQLQDDVDELKSNASSSSTKVPSKGIVLGDSISFGLYSFWDGNNRKNADDLTNNIDETAADKRISDWLADYYGIPIDNIAKRGTGWVADTRRLGNAWVKAQATDFSQYGFVGLCFGVNDWIQNSPIGTIADNAVGTVIGNMIHTIEKIYTDNPLCKVVVFSPLNTWGQWRDTTGALQTLYGDAASHYALGTANNAGYTLQQLIDAMDSVCDAYDIRHVVMSQGCTINMFNIKNILIDGLHPSEESMKSIASDMYHTMLFR